MTFIVIQQKFEILEITLDKNQWLHYIVRFVTLCMLNCKRKV